MKKNLDKLSLEELDVLTDKIANALRKILPRDANFILLLGTNEHFIGEISTVDRMEVPNMLRKAAEILELDQIERN